MVKIVKSKSQIGDHKGILKVIDSLVYVENTRIFDSSALSFCLHTDMGVDAIVY